MRFFRSPDFLNEIQMKKIIFIYLLLLGYLFVYSQIPMNKEVKFMDFISNEGPIIMYDDTIICMGHGTDSIAYSTYDMFIAKMDMDGSIISLMKNKDADYYSTYFKNAYLDGDNLIFAIGVVERNNSWEVEFEGAYILIVDLVKMSIVKKIKIGNPENGNNDFIYAIDLKKLDSINYSVLFTIEKEGSSKGDPMVAIVNIKTDDIRYIELGQESYSDRSYCFEWTGKKLLIGTSITDEPFDILNPYQKRNIWGQVYEVDTSGSWKIAYSTENHRGSIRSIFATKNNEYICGAHEIEYYNKPNTDDYIFHNNLVVFKLDSAYNLIWEKPWGFDFDVNWLAITSNIIEAEEGDGYILLGYQPNFRWNKFDPGPWADKEVEDSLRNLGIPLMTVAVLQKIDENGDSIWLRSYSAVSDTSVNFIEHEVTDLTYSPDGGYIIYGDIAYAPIPGRDTANNYPGWLLKIDRYGCLVPGCQGEDTTNIVENNELEKNIMLYPNPVSDDLYIYQRESGLISYSITDISGRQIRQWRGNLPNHTYIVDVSGYKSGIYVLNIVTDKRDRYSKKFVVE